MTSTKALPKRNEFNTLSNYQKYQNNEYDYDHEYEHEW